MQTCSKCGGESADEARFCQFCGTELGPAELSRELRKIVTIVFADIAGSTSLGERKDPETLRRVVGRYFDAMRAAIERHGGTVEKFVGDAVMAVFGVPTVHEDDALRAVRAAVDMRDALGTLNDQLLREHGVRLAMRTGVNTGPVLTGDPSARERLVTGDAVNVAARLEQHAEAGEILIGAETYGLVRDAVQAEEVEPLTLKGKGERVAAYRLADVRTGAAGHERNLSSPMVGRDRQLRMLVDAFEDIAKDRSCRLFTILGSPGVGKSRLVLEFLRRVDQRATVARGRCLSYGDGITFWPIVSILEDLGGDDAPSLARVLGGADDSALVADRVARLVGYSPEPVPIEEAFWAVRKLLEHLARHRAVVVLLDDIHWAEPTLLDLIEHIADWSRDAPVLLLCTARPELLDVRPNWGGGKLNATSMLLEPLTQDESISLMSNLLGDGGLTADARERIARAAEGNPLFVEEMLAMLVDEGLLVRDGETWRATATLDEVAVPTTIQTLLSARLDRLPGDDRVVIERGAVEGNVFHVGGVVELAPEGTRGNVRSALMSLVRKELIRPDRAELAGDEAFRFRHLLIRDAAYEAMPMETRAELHERFATWLDGRPADAVTGYDAVVAYHLEQAYRYRSALAGADARTDALAELAGSRYAAAGEAALAHADHAGAIALLERAIELLPADHELEPSVWLALGDARLLTGDFLGADEALRSAEERAGSRGKRQVELRAAVHRLRIRERLETDWSLERLIDASERLEAALLEIGDEAGVAEALLVRANTLCRPEGLLAADRAVVHAREAGDAQVEAEALSWSTIIGYWGDTPASETVSRARVALERSNARVPTAVVLAILGGSLGMLGRFDEGRQQILRSRDMLAELGVVINRPFAFTGGFLELFAGDLAAADRWWRDGYETFAALGEKSRLSTLAATIGFARAEQGDDEDALRFAGLGEQAASPDDSDTHAAVALTRSVVARHRSDNSGAIALAERAAALDHTRGASWQRGIDLTVLAEALLAAGRQGEAIDRLGEAIAAFDAKEILPLADRTRVRLQEIGGAEAG